MSRPRSNVQQKKQSTGKSDEIKKVDTNDMRLTPYMEALKPFEETNAATDNQTDSFILLASIPSESQFLQTRAMIAEKTTRLSQLRSKYEEDKRALQQLKETIKVAEQELFEAKARIAPVSRIPAEVLGLVFEIHVWEHNESPWVLTQVSRSWRASALMKRTLWGRIILATSNWRRPQQDGLPLRFHDGREVCLWHEQLSRALTRAGATPLDLKVMLPPEHQQTRWALADEKYEKDLTGFINLILEQQENPRLRSLEISTDDKWTLLPEQLEKLSFSNLTSLALDAPHPKLVEKAVAEVDRLQSLRVQAVSLRELRTCKWWEGLEELSIIDFCPEEESNSVGSALSDAKSLTSLTLGVSDFGNFHNWHGGFPQLTMPTITSLKLLDLDFLWPVNCPNLTYLELCMPSGRYVADRSIHLPHLLKMKVVHFSSYNPLSAFDVPSLYTLNLHASGGKGAAAGFFKGLWPLPSATATTKDTSSNIEPHLLLLEDTEINQKTLARALMERTHLEELSTIKVEITSEFFDSLMPVMRNEKRTKKVPQGAEPMNRARCPTFKRMKLDLSGRKLKQEREELERSAKKWLDARSEAGVPLKRLAILYSKDEEWRDLVEQNS